MMCVVNLVLPFSQLEGIESHSMIEGGGDVTNVSPFWEEMARK